MGKNQLQFSLSNPTPKAITPYSVEEPFGPIQPQQSSSYSSSKARFPYVKKPFVQHISYIEPHLVHIRDPLTLAMEVLPQEHPHLGKVCSYRKHHEQKGPLSGPIP